MKYAYVAALFAASVYAQDEPADPTPTGAYPVTPFDELLPIVQPYAQSLININDSTLALDAQIGEFQGVDQIFRLAQASVSLFQTIQAETVTDEALPSLENNTIDDIIGLATYVVNLGYYVNQTIFDLVEKKQLLVDACAGDIVLEQLSSQSSAASVYQSVLIGKLTSTLTDIALGLATTIPQALESGISAFADQTSVPASCSATTTSEGSEPTSTGSVPTSTGTSSRATITTTYGAQPTAGKPWEAMSSFYSLKSSIYSIKGSVYSSNGQVHSSVSSKTASGNPYEWSPVTSGAVHPTYAVSGSSKPATSTGKIVTYTGAANAHQIGGFVAAAALVAAVL